MGGMDYEGTTGPFTPGGWAPAELEGGWPPLSLARGPGLAGSPHLPWPQADRCQTSPAFSLHSLPLGHVWPQYVASFREGMQKRQPATIPAVLQADRTKGLPDASGKLGEWICMG